VTQKRGGRRLDLLTYPLPLRMRQNSRRFLAPFTLQMFLLASCIPHGSSSNVASVAVSYSLAAGSFSGKQLRLGTTASSLHLIQCPQTFKMHGKRFSQSFVCPSLLAALNFIKGSHQGSYTNELKFLFCPLVSPSILKLCRHFFTRGSL